MVKATSIGVSMKTVHEVSELAGVSIRTLHHYDRIGLLKPAGRSQAGYRLYSQDDLAKLQHILLFRELEFSLGDIKGIVDSPDFDQDRALEQQIELLELRRDHIDKLIGLAKAMRKKREGIMSFDAFDTSKMDEYAAKARASWGNTPEWAEYEKKGAGRSAREQAALGDELMSLFKPFGEMATAKADPAGAAAQAQARVIQDFITQHYYTCTDEVFAQLGRAYGAGGDFTRNIDEAASAGAAEFASKAIEAYASHSRRP